MTSSEGQWETKTRTASVNTPTSPAREHAAYTTVAVGRHLPLRPGGDGND